MKKYLVLVMALLLLVVAGCGGAEEPAETPEAPVEETPAEDATEEPAEEPAEEASGYQYDGTAFMSAEQLSAALDAGDDVIVIGVVSDVKALVPFSLESSAPAETTYRVWRPDYSGEGSTEAISTNIGGFRLAPEVTADLLSKAGATPESTIVVYSAGAMHDSARFYWQLKLIGHENAFMLDGGIDNFDAMGFDTGGDLVTLANEEAVSEYTYASYDPAALGVDIVQVIEALNNPAEWVVIDTRAAGEYNGEETSSSSGAFGTGALTGAVHIEWTEALNEDATLKTVEELEAIYGDLIEGKKVITFCQSGVRSSHTQAVLMEALGATDVYNYDGSWIEWSYVASEYSTDVAAELKADVLALTDKWTDNNGAI